ncbi:MAG: DUF4357 domain-containing protein [Planctomycetes bacterium]|nr:DUF4357 domain-containing protein [Planctomycetota bacterium]
MPHFQLIDADLTCIDTDFDVIATGHLEGQSVLVVHTGSTARGDGLRDARMLEWGVVERCGKRLKFLLDFPFKSSASAASFVLGGRQPAGIDSWKDSSAQTLRQLHIANGLGWLVGESKG